MGISTVLSLQRSHRQGAVYDSAEFANSIRWFSETREGLQAFRLDEAIRTVAHLLRRAITLV
jgi:hypothetical protein